MKPKELLAVSAALIIMMSTFCDSNLAHSERVSSITPDRTLVVKEVTTLLSVPKVPKGITLAEQADSLATGQLGKVIIKDEVGERISSFALPFIKSTMKYTDEEVMYCNGWMTQNAPDRFTASYDDYCLTLFWLFLVAVLIIVVGIVNAVVRISTKKLLVFYAVIFAGIATSVLVGGIAGMFTGYVVGMLVGAITGAFAGVFATEKLTIRSLPSRHSLGGGIGVITGGVAGLFASMISGAFASQQNYKIVAYYCLFLLAIEIVSFVISQIVKVAYLASEKRHAASEHRHALMTGFIKELK